MKRKRPLSILNRLSAGLLAPSLSLGVANKYVTDGFQVGEDHLVIQPGVGLTHRDLSLGVGAWGSLSTERARSTYDEWDLLVHWSPTYSWTSRMQLSPTVHWIYWLYPNSGSESEGRSDLRGNKLVTGGTLHTLLAPAQSLWSSLGYHFHRWFYWENNQRSRNLGGGRHALRMDVQSPIASTPVWWKVANEWSYHTGFLGVNPGWSHTQLSAGVRSNSTIGTLEFTMHRQWSFEDTVNPEDETWGTFQFSVAF